MLDLSVMGTDPAIDHGFYLSTDVVGLAQDLIGCTLHSKIDGVTTSGKIVETEAYRAPEDKASHAYGAKRTARTETMYAEGGICYIYLCYGIHHLFNLVTGPKDVPHAILIRAIEPLEGIEKMLERRNMAKLSYRLTAGPGSLSKAMGISKDLNGTSITKSEEKIWLQPRQSKPGVILASPRVGVGYAEECASWPWRFRLENSRWCSPAK